MSDEKDPGVRVVDRRWWARKDNAGSSEDQTVSLKPTYVEELERRVAEANEQLQNYIIEHRRSLEEFDQAKARIRRDVTREVERGKRTVLVELLEVLDNLDRAVAAAHDAGSSAHADALNTLARGVELVRDQFLAKLESFGVVRVPAIGEPFDASRHEAVATTPVPDSKQNDVVVSVVKEGYNIGKDVLRPASVVVGSFDKG